MMKVGILTWHKAINHGAILQAYASCKILESLCTSPVVLEYNWSLYAQERRNEKKALIRKIKKMSPSKVIVHYHVKKFFKVKQSNFQMFYEKYLPIGKMYNEETDLDAVYIGSDMVFDIRQGYNPFMHGEGISAEYIFSYAASFGYSTKELLQASKYYEKIKKNICSIKEIGYRDHNTYKLCKMLGVTAPLVETVDPVLCYGFNEEIESWDSKKWKTRKYILIYAYDSTMNDKETTNAIRRYAKKNHLEVVSCGYYHKWCDECVPASPTEFLEMFKYAQYIITDTFHGTVFSLILHKQFVTIVRNNAFKVQYLLNCAELESRIVNAPLNIQRVLDEKTDFRKYDEWIRESRKLSISFIKNNIRKASEISK